MAYNVAGYADIYSDDVLWTQPKSPDQKSKEGIKNDIQGLFEKFKFKVNPRPEEIEVQNDFAYANALNHWSALKHSLRHHSTEPARAVYRGCREAVSVQKLKFMTDF